MVVAPGRPMQLVVIVQLLMSNGQDAAAKRRCCVVRPPPRCPRRLEMEQGSSSRWAFRVRATIKPFASHATETIGSVAFDSSNELMATGGIARKIRVYDISAILDSEDKQQQDQAADEDDEDGLEDEDEEGRFVSSRRRARNTFDTDRSSLSVICAPSRLSSLQWRPGKTGTIACGDYDGVVTEWSVERQIPLVERDEHGGRHVWSVDYATDMSGVCVSASDDGTARVWQGGMERSALTIRAPDSKPFCCAEFDPLSSTLLALACADGKVYVHDLRRPECPVWTLAHHRRAASYARFLDRERLVTASVDSTICVWDLAAPPAPRVVESFSQHQNVRNFVGLSVWRKGEMVACGSETNQAYVYQVGSGGGGDQSFVLRHQFSSSSWSSSTDSSSARRNSSLASAVCWMEDCSCTLAAANSEGVLQILSGEFGGV
ncbi:hypothetical protein SELMODRAFT_444188 [Selaginella moellendorffii]|uniref:Uncharacterized protein n=1 Tax=Selaginella moellendorffii TaxID=88036 RepID=D8S7Q0_SELML|nr:WD repeat-containing protein RUP1 [Selaginella moellendorffii]XP_024540132.1 WD repeat-containing protein RUP1 [Selaginella moellendorffii]EFJ19649.1 hypothetical protein SELMODRAFT_444188 [Selaginella moellendorffii]|eukprot:XP_002979241.1 WD repeat-containing protein RUP1 [Selaginella moellendorffii]